MGQWTCQEKARPFIFLGVYLLANHDFPRYTVHVNREHGAERKGGREGERERFLGKMLSAITVPASEEVAISSSSRGKRIRASTADHDDNDDDGDYEMTRER